MSARIQGLVPRWRRALAWLSVLGASAVPAQAQPVPPHWIHYADQVGRQLQQRLSDPANEAAFRLQAWMQQRILSSVGPQGLVPLVVRVWIDLAGRVERVEFDSLGHAQADADLRGVLSGQSIGEPPPQDLRQPMVLQLGLDFHPGGQGDGA